MEFYNLRQFLVAFFRSHVERYRLNVIDIRLRHQIDVKLFAYHFPMWDINF
jgi:hypothetical protein